MGIEPYHPILPHCEIRRMQRLRLEEGENCPVHLWSVRLHQVEHESRRAISFVVHDPQHRVVSISNRFDLNLALKNIYRAIDAASGEAGQLLHCAGGCIAACAEKRTPLDLAGLQPFRTRRARQNAAEAASRAAQLTL
jgi:hypothetical protein